MSASQLLRILQTLPACVDDEICAFNTDELVANTNRGSRCTNPFLSNEDENQVDFWNNQPELESSTFGNEFTNNHEDEAFRKYPAACNVRSHSLAGFHIDKHSVECTLPELIVCYKDKESGFHVKDICIDEGVSDEETTSIHKDNNHEFLYNSVPVNGDDDDDMIECGLDTEFLKHDWLRSSSMACCSMDVELNYGPDNSTHICDQANLNFSTNLQDVVFKDQLVSNSMISLQQDWSLTSLDFPVASNSYDDDHANQHPLQGSEYELGKRAVVGSVAESTYKLPLETDSVVDQPDKGCGYKVAVKDHDTRYVGESSFSMAGVISELISGSRPMPFAGGISNRSDSSATSTKSFAFPTLETEYTSSPVRMGKSERKRLQKHRRWRKGLICCNF